MITHTVLEHITKLQRYWNCASEIIERAFKCLSTYDGIEKSEIVENTNKIKLNYERNSLQGLMDNYFTKWKSYWTKSEIAFMCVFCRRSLKGFFVEVATSIKEIHDTFQTIVPRQIEITQRLRFCRGNW